MRRMKKALAIILMGVILITLIPLLGLPGIQSQVSAGTYGNSTGTVEVNGNLGIKADYTIETGLYLDNDGVWRYYEDGEFKNVTGLVMNPNKGTWHFVGDGIYSKKTGMVQCVQPGASYGRFFFVENGIYTKKTGMVQSIQPGASNGKWFYVLNGIYTKKTGMVQSIQPGASNGRFYFVLNGIYTKKTGMVQSIQPGASYGRFFFVENGIYSKKTGMVQSIQPGTSYGKFYFVENGIYTKKTWIVQSIQPGASKGNWYFIRNGIYDNTYTGIAKRLDDGQHYYIIKGYLKPDYTSLAKHGSNFYAVRNGKVDYGYTGVIQNKANGNWHYVKNGIYDRSFTGFAPIITNGKHYYVRNGYVSLTFTGTATYEGISYKIVNGLVKEPVKKLTSYGYVFYNGNRVPYYNNTYHTPKYSYEVCFVSQPYLGIPRTRIDCQTFIYVKTNNPNPPRIQLCNKDGEGRGRMISLVTSSELFQYSSSVKKTLENVQFTGENKVEGGYLYHLNIPYYINHVDYSIDDDSYIPAGDYYVKIDEDESDNFPYPEGIIVGPMTFLDVYEEETKWMQSVINKNCKSGMTKEAQMNAICDYMHSISVYGYDRGSLQTLSTPNWLRPNPSHDSYSSPYMIVEFGKMIGYPLESCYEWYITGKDDWTMHYYAYSNADDTYFSFCPYGDTKGEADMTTVNFNNYDYYNVLKVTP